MTKPDTQIDPLARSVGVFMDAHQLAVKGEAMVVGVSGGADSAALLAILCELAAAGGDYRLTVAHLDHALRDKSADEAAWVGELARGKSLAFVTERVDVRQLAVDAEGGIEQAARDARYAFLTRVTRQVGAQAVAVGHHADDNVETVLHRIIRGTHLRGLSGIGVCRPLCEGVSLIRPLLCCTRGEIEAYCRRASMEWLCDSSNADTRYTRNFIRHELLPMLRDRVNPKADEAIARLAAAAADAEALIAAGAEAIVQAAVRQEDNDHVAIGITAFEGVADVVAAAAMRMLLERLGVPMRQVGSACLGELTALARGTTGGAIVLSGGFEARRRGGEIIFSHAGRGDDAPGMGDTPVELACPGDTVVGAWRIRCELGPLDREAFKRNCSRTGRGGSQDERVEMLDADCLRMPLTCRSRRSGDSFQPLGAPGRQSVSDFLTNLKLAEARRVKVVCICDGDGIACVVPLRIAHRVRVTDSTERVVTVTICRYKKL